MSDFTSLTDSFTKEEKILCLDPVRTNIYSFIKLNCNQQPTFKLFNTLVHYFSKAFQIKTTRNDYRRINQCVYWLDQNSERIFDYILEKGGHIVIQAPKGMKEPIILKNTCDFRMKMFESRLKKMKITYRETDLLEEYDERRIFF